MNKVLIITYYWPPSGGSGVQRWLKFVKYLPAYGWEPHVFTPENPSFAVLDPSLEKDVPADAEVIRFPIWEPYDIFLRMSGWLGRRKVATPTALVPAKSGTLFQRINTWIRGNFFIPDPRRFWVRPSVAFLSDYLADNDITTIITTGPPHSMHLIGLKLKLKHPHLRWLADFRDPWSEWGLWDSLRVSNAVRRIHKKMEARVLAHADEIITITPFYARRFEVLARRPVRLLTNGFDDEDFIGMDYKKTENFMVRHVGLVNEKCDPRPFMRALQKEIKENPDFASRVRVEFIGEVHDDFRRYIEAEPGLAKVVLFPGSVAHTDLIKLYGSSALLLLILTGYKDAEGFLPGKLFEYFATGIPILGVGPANGDAAALMNEIGTSVMVESDDEVGIRTTLRSAYENWRLDQRQAVNSGKVRSYSRRQITGELVQLLHRPNSKTSEKY
jgi:glycosyltransferase involved in cell wall biosynthesis